MRPRTRAARGIAGLLVAVLVMAHASPAAGVAAGAAAGARPTVAAEGPAELSPPETPVPFPPSTGALDPERSGTARPSYTRAYVAMGAGVALSLASFVLAESADRAYDRYLAAVDPDVIESSYDEARRLDRWSAATLLVGQGAIALGIYLRFIRRPPAMRSAALPGAVGFAPGSGIELASSPDPELALTPVATRHRVGLALSYRFR